MFVSSVYTLPRAKTYLNRISLTFLEVVHLISLEVLRNAKLFLHRQDLQIVSVSSALPRLALYQPQDF